MIIVYCVTFCCLLIVSCGIYLLSTVLRSYPLHYKLPIIAVVGIQGLQGICMAAILFDVNLWPDMVTTSFMQAAVKVAWTWLAVVTVAGVMIARRKKSIRQEESK